MEMNSESKDIILVVIQKNQWKIRVFGVRKTGLFGAFAALTSTGKKIR